MNKPGSLQSIAEEYEQEIQAEATTWAAGSKIFGLSEPALRDSYTTAELVEYLGLVTTINASTAENTRKREQIEALRRLVKRGVSLGLRR